LDGPLPKLCPAVALSNQDGLAVIIESFFNPGGRLQVPGSFWFFLSCFVIFDLKYASVSFDFS
jgi:hypothetical protein